MTEKYELPSDIREALHGRGFTDPQIEEMSASRIFDEYCGWHLGDQAWGADFRKVMEAAEKFARSRK